MKIIIAIDSFKGSLSSIEAEQAVQNGILQMHPDWGTTLIPIADGGEGMLSVMLNATQGQIHTIEAHNPRMKKIMASYGTSNDGKTAFIEMAAISGLPLISKEEQNPMKTTTYGTGELIRDALEKGCAEFILGIGGSATNDAGTGMLQALGFRFYDNKGNLLEQGGEILEKISSINQEYIHPLLKNAHFTVACDVQNPFFGPNGAAYIFAKQKGADDTMTADLDKGMCSFAKVIHKETGIDISLIPGSGAAGGMGGGLMAFLNAKLKSGADLLLNICHFEEATQEADLIITGEGRIDHQSLMGKIPGKILAKGIKHEIPVIAIAGCVEDKEVLDKAGFKGIYEIKPKNMPLEMAMQRDVAIRNIQETVTRIEF